MEFHGDFKKLYQTVKEKLSSAGSCHGFDHTLRVMHNAGVLLASVPDADAETIAGIRQTVRMLLDGSLPGEALYRILTERITVYRDHTAEIRLTGLSAVFHVGE